MSSEKKSGKAGYLFKNMALFTAGSFVSKLLVFFLVPFYTSVLTESEYGIADVMQTSLLLLIPLLTVNAGEAALRYGLECTDDRDLILLSGLKKVVLSIIPVCVGAFVLSFLFSGQRIYFLLFIILYIADSFYEYISLYCQGCEEVKKMISGSIMCTALVIGANILFLLCFRLGIYGYLFAQILAFSGAGILMFLLVNGPERLKNAKRNTALTEEMSQYGRSMLLYSTASWANNAIDRYFILFLLGTVQNGLYGVAYKIPAILTTLQRIFAMAWQMSAVKEYKGDDRESFFSEMYNSYQTILIIGCAGILLFLKLIASLMFRKAFFEAWILVPPLLISVVFGALEGFLGSIALAFKDGKSMGRATGIGALFNIVLNSILILKYGAFGAAAATLISYFVMFFLAFIFVRKHMILKVSVIRDVAAYLLLLAESALLISDVRYQMIMNCGIVLILLLLYFREARGIILRSINMIKRRTEVDGQD